METEEKKRLEDISEFIDTVDPKDVKWKDIIALLLAKLTLGSSNIWKSKIFKTLLALIVFYFAINTYFTLERKTVAIPGNFIDTSEFTKYDDENPINGVSVKHFVRDGVLDHLALSILFWGEYKYIEEVPLNEVNTSPTLKIGDDVYDMQMSAYLAVQNYIGNNKPYTSKVFVTQVPVISSIPPNILPADEIVSIDGALIKDSMEVEIAKLKRRVHNVVVVRGNEVVEVESDLYNIETRKVITLDNMEDYQEFNSFANLGLEGYLGRSAGSALALEYYNKAIKDVAKDRKIALTGNIAPTGEIGFITGIKQKTVLAIRNDVDIMFVPKDNNITTNYSDAVKVAKDLDSDITIVVMDNFSDVIDYLNR